MPDESNAARLATVQRRIEQRQVELMVTANRLARRAKVNHWTSSTAKVILVILGATAATKATADQILGSGNLGGTIVYAFLGVLTAAIAGIIAAFNFENRAAQLTQLAAETWATRREVDTEWSRKVGLADASSAIKDGLDLAVVQDNKLADIQGRAARLGINIALDIPGDLEHASDSRRPTDRQSDQRPHPPY